MSRGAVTGLPTARPLAEALPGVYQEQEGTAPFVSVFDDALAPVFVTLDNVDAYFDPRLTPSDFLHWIAGWVGAALDERWPEDRSRAVVANTVDLYRRRGTIRGLADHIEILAGVRPEIVDSGGVSVSQEPGAPLPGQEVPHLHVTIPHVDLDDAAMRRLEILVGEAKPAHIPHSFEVAQG